MSIQDTQGGQPHGKARLVSEPGTPALKSSQELYFGPSRGLLLPHLGSRFGVCDVLAVLEELVDLDDHELHVGQLALEVVDPGSLLAALPLPVLQLLLDLGKAGLRLGGDLQRKGNAGIKAPSCYPQRKRAAASRTTPRLKRTSRHHVFALRTFS